MALYFSQQGLIINTFEAAGTFGDLIAEVETLPFARSTSLTEAWDDTVPNLVTQFLGLVGTTPPLLISMYLRSATQPFNALVRFVDAAGDYEFNFRSVTQNALFQCWTDNDVDDIEITFDGFEPLDSFTYDVIYEPSAETPLFLPKGSQVS